MKSAILWLSFFAGMIACQANTKNAEERIIKTGAEQIHLYLPLLTGKNVAAVVNQTSMIGQTHLIDTLIALNIPLKKIFAPEHGYRGDKDAGETVKNDVDARTGLPVISLYGSNKKPTAEQLAGIDVVLFDMQDVGARFYTYISAMHYVMEACAENDKTLLILDRPNPNGDYVDGPVLQSDQRSYVGMHPIPVVHGLTIGELAKMINGEGWLKDSAQCKLEVIPVANYTHSAAYSLPVNPSPNLPNDLSVALYPSLCFFEGTIVSVARGTRFPFQALGHPDKRFGDSVFTPGSIPGMAKNPPYENQVCYGLDLRNKEPERNLDLSYLIRFYNLAEDKDRFFNSFFDKLAGNKQLKERIKAGWTEEQIKAEWQEDLKAYMLTRSKYLLYPD